MSIRAHERRGKSDGACALPSTRRGEPCESKEPVSGPARAKRLSCFGNIGGAFQHGVPSRSLKVTECKGLARYLSPKKGDRERAHSLAVTALSIKQTALETLTRRSAHAKGDAPTIRQETVSAPQCAHLRSQDARRAGQSVGGPSVQSNIGYVRVWLMSLGSCGTFSRMRSGRRPETRIARID